jgi:branched-chain amino acid transport system substrate-binding protein
MKMSTAHWLVAGALISASTSGFAQGKPACGLNNGKPATGAPIPIGAIVGKTGPDDFSASSQAAAAYFKCVNANGGINGRPVDYMVQDDQWNPEVAAQAASRLVKDRKVVAMVGNSSFVECGANAKFYAQEDIMAVAGVGVPRECFFAKNYAPVNTGPRISGGIVSQYAVQKYKLKSLVCIPTNIPGLGAWACEGVSDWGKANGVQVKTLPIDPGSADATSVMLQAAAMKPDGIVINLPPAPATMTDRRVKLWD